MYEKEAAEIIGIVYDAQYNSEEQTRKVAHYLTELIAATSYGCTGLTADPSGPQLAAAAFPDGSRTKTVLSIPEPAPARGVVRRGDGPRAEEVTRRLRTGDWDME